MPMEAFSLCYCLLLMATLAMSFAMPTATTIVGTAGGIVHGPGGHHHYGAGLIVMALRAFPLFGVMRFAHHYHGWRSRAANVDGNLGVGRRSAQRQKRNYQKSSEKEDFQHIQTVKDREAKYTSALLKKHAKTAELHPAATLYFLDLPLLTGKGMG